MLIAQKIFSAWERRLAYRDDPERRVLPFDWGTDFMGNGTLADDSARRFLHQHSEEALAASDGYFQPPEVSDFRLEDSELTFTTPLPTPHPENNQAHGRFFPSGEKGPAVVVLPQWNAQPGAQNGLCRLFNLYRLTALKLSLPYHGPRMPAGLLRADYMLSPNLGRTLHACRQAVLEVRAAVSWLIERGFGPIGVVGTSLGSCIAFIAYAHDKRIGTGVFNHISPFFADVVWRGLSTRHIRQGLEGRIELDELRKLWLPISPQSYAHRLKKGGRSTLLIFARYDLSFPPDLSQLLIEEFERLEIPHERVVLPCGHYTTALFPFNFMDGFAMARFLRRKLGY
jgi:dienelactone hydrolase